jgi:hypothetical protein
LQNLRQARGRAVRTGPTLQIAAGDAGFFIMAFSVVRGMPRRAAAALITPPVSRKMRRM